MYSCWSGKKFVDVEWFHMEAVVDLNCLTTRRWNLGRISRGPFRNWNQHKFVQYTVSEMSDEAESDFTSKQYSPLVRRRFKTLETRITHCGT